jgi:putative ABC transport system substrate-binding protein
MQAQQPERRVGVLMNRAERNQEGLDRLAAFRQGLLDCGWQIGRDLEIEIRWGEDDAELERKGAAELIALSPDVVLASGSMSVAAFQSAGTKLPIVFSAVADPIGAGFVDDLTRPGANTTGFMIYEYSLGAKWIELLKQIAPNLARVAIVRNAANPAGVALYSALHTACQSLGLEPHSINVRNSAELDRLVMAFARTLMAGWQ